jgi:hypothetical protein
VELPRARVLHSSLDEDKTRLHDRDPRLLRIRGNDALLEEARRDAEDKMVKRDNISSHVLFVTI